MFESRIPSVNLKTQVIQEIVRYIHTMDLSRDNKLPREEELCKIIGTSRVTLRAALDELEANGMVLRKHGKGTFANPHSLDVKVSFNPAIDFFESILLSGYQPSAKVLFSAYVPLPAECAEDFGLEAGQRVWCTKKIIYADGRFCAYLEDFINTALLDDPSQLEHCSFELPIFSLLDEKFNLRIEWDKVELSAVESQYVPALAELVGQGVCKDGAMLLLRGVNYDAAGQAVLCGWEYIDTDLLRFNQLRKRQWTNWSK